jgi:1,4-dihydroxy-2-naphthoate octaprenyltransferase
MTSHGGRRRWRELLSLGRVYMLVPGLLLYMLGWGIALALGQAFDAGRFLLGYAAFALPHLSVSYSDDYFDQAGDRLGAPSGLSGGSGVLLRAPELAPTALRMAKALLGLGFLTALLFALAYPDSWPVLIVFLAGGLLGWFYSAPPLRLSARGWGEVAAMAGVGIIMPLAGFMCSGHDLMPSLALLMVPLACFALTFILSVELPDAEADRLSGKNTYVSRQGLEGGSILIALASCIGTLSFLLIAMWGGLLPREMMALFLASLLPTFLFILMATARPDPFLRAKAGVSMLMVFLVIALSALLFA